MYSQPSLSFHGNNSVDGEPRDLLPDLLKYLLITVIVLLGVKMRWHPYAEGFRRSKSC